MKSSWKTTLFGVLAVIGCNVALFFPEYARLGNFIAAVASGLGLLFARDNNRTSEDVGAKPQGLQLPLLAILLLPMILMTGCMNMRQAETVTDLGTNNIVTVHTFFNNGTLKGFQANSTTAKTKTGLKIQSSDNETATEAIQASGDLFGGAAGAAFKKSLGLP